MHRNTIKLLQYIENYCKLCCTEISIGYVPVSKQMKICEPFYMDFIKRARIAFP